MKTQGTQRKYKYKDQWEWLYWPADWRTGGLADGGRRTADCQRTGLIRARIKLVRRQIKLVRQQIKPVYLVCIFFSYLL